MISSAALTIWAIASTVPGAHTQVPVPHDAVAAVFLAPAETRSAQTGGATGIELAAFLLQQARESGLTVGLGASANAVADVVGSLPLLGRYPVACVLLEVRAKELSGGGVRLAELRGGLVLHTRGQCEPVAHRVQELLNLYTSKEHSRIETSSVDSVTSFVLTDDRLPEWAVIEWGEVGEAFIIAIGPGAFARIARSVRQPELSLGNDAWYAAAHRTCNVRNASFELYLDAERLRGQLGPRVLDTVDRVAAGIRCAELQRGLWAVGRAGDMIEASCMLRSSGQDRHIPITVPAETSPGAAAAIPPQATTHAVFRVAPRDLVLRVRDGYLAARSESTRRRLLRLWAEHVRGESGWSVEEELLDSLGGCIVVHNAPPHPLGIPLACTILIEIDGSPERVSASLDTLLGAAQKYLDRPPDGESKGGFALRRAADGVWYVYMGLYGPALAVTEHWVVISYAPDAVRQNVRFLQDRFPALSPATRPVIP